MAAVGEFIVTLHADGSLTHSGLRLLTEAEQHAAAAQTVTAAVPGSQVVSDPWQTQQPGSGVNVTSAAALQSPACVHGPLKAVPGGFSQAKQKPYTAFWACPAPRGQQCRLDPKQLPPVPA